jgi:hypothetical protein
MERGRSPGHIVWTRQKGLDENQKCDCGIVCITHGAVSPSENDFGMLRLALLCLLPQLAGVLIMVGRSK